VGQADPLENGESEVAAADCRAQLERILRSPDFEATDREHRFLQYVVEEALSGRSERIKAYSIAIEVFGRDVSFDPQTDPIVRIEAGHLRRALERYYLTAGVSDPILITVPKGGYVPIFSRRSPQGVAPAGPPAPALEIPANTALASAGKHKLIIAAMAFFALMLAGGIAWWGKSPPPSPMAPERPRLLVQPFDDLAGTSASAAIARGLSLEVIGQLSKFKDIIVHESVETRPDGSVPQPRFTLSGSVDLLAEEFRLRVRLINRADDSVLWANSYDGKMDVGEVLRAESDIARNVATTLAQSYGVISKADATIHMDNPPDDWTAYTCALSFYAYRAEANLNQLPDVRRCLEEAVARFPNYATAWGLLSQAYIDGMRFSYPFDPATSSKTIEEALAAAKRAVEIDPFNVRGLQAQMFALYFTKDVDAAIAVGKRAMEINPNDPELMGEYGYRLAQSGNWEEGCSLVSEARNRNPGPVAYYETALALCAYFAGDYKQAAVFIRRAAAIHNPNYHAIAAAVFAEGGYSEEADQERAWLETNVPALIKNARREVSLRFMRPSDVELFLGSLKKAGLDIKD